MRTLIVTDAWRPQVNGVVRTMEEVVGRLRAAGGEVELIQPGDYRTMPMPTYPEIRLAFAPPGDVRRRIAAFSPEHVHIVTEGPLGMAARRACRRLGLAFTTSYHTRFPEYVRARAPVPLALTYALMRSFHNAGVACLVATDSIATELRGRGFNTVVEWTRGVDRDLFHPRPETDFAARFGLVRPVFMNVGRVAVEKNLETFLELDLPGTKVIVGDGPSLEKLRKRFPKAVFAGTQTGLDLAQWYNAADVFVFPSLTDTFGNVLLESLASGVPVAAFPVPGPLDVIGTSGAGVLDQDLRKAALAALDIPREAALERARRYSWEECVRIFQEAGELAASANRGKTA
jgi:glycosyltransferase involved in cell wall biosynthesis